MKYIYIYIYIYIYTAKLFLYCLKKPSLFRYYYYEYQTSKVEFYYGSAFLFGQFHNFYFLLNESLLVIVKLYAGTWWDFTHKYQEWCYSIIKYFLLWNTCQGFINLIVGVKVLKISLPFDVYFSFSY